MDFYRYRMKNRENARGIRLVIPFANDERKKHRIGNKHENSGQRKTVYFLLQRNHPQHHPLR